MGEHPEAGKEILVIDFTEGGVGGEGVVQAVRHEFPSVTIAHITEFARVHAALRCTTYGLVIIVTDGRIRDAQIYAERIRTCEFLNFDGRVMRGTGSKTPVIVCVSDQHFPAFAQTSMLQCINMNADMSVLVGAVAACNFPRRRVHDPFETHTVESHSPGESQYRSEPTSGARKGRRV